MNFRNGLELLVKNLPKSRLIPVILTRMVLDGIVALKFLLSGQLGDFFAIFKAHFSFYSRLNKTYRKRSGNYTKLRQQFDGSIVYQYFVKGKKKFNSLPADKL